MHGMSKLRDQRLKKLYGLNPGEYERILEFQGRVCAICKRPPKDGKHLHVDHSHKTGVTRGLICWHDNRALGGFRDSLERLENAAEYIKTPPAIEALGGERVGFKEAYAEKIRRAKAVLADDAEWRTAQELVAARALAARRAEKALLVPDKVLAYVTGRDVTTTREVVTEGLEVPYTKAN